RGELVLVAHRGSTVVHREALDYVGMWLRLRFEVVDVTLVRLAPDGTDRNEEVSVPPDRPPPMRVFRVEEDVLLLVADDLPVLHCFVERLAHIDVGEDPLAGPQLLELERKLARNRRRADARDRAVLTLAAIPAVIRVDGQTLPRGRQVHDRLAEALRDGVLAAVLDHLVPELVRIDDEIDAVAAGVVSARGSAARHALDERGDVLDDVGLVVTQAELDRLVTIEHGRATLGYVIAEQPEEVLAEARIVALDLVDREGKQVAPRKLARGNVLRLCLP